VRLSAFALLAFLCACGGSTTGGGDLFNDAAPGDASASDGSSDGGVDARPDAACAQACVADWCGCGQCLESQIVCTQKPKPCPLGCASACTILPDVKCHCEADRCVHDTAQGTAACYTDLDCPIGQCCSTRGASLSGTCAPNGDPCCNATCK
jgi:hypothetical protein